MIKNIKLVKKSYVKEGNKWNLIETETNNVDEKVYTNIIDSKRFFVALGGHERHEKNYTKYGYRVIRVNSISPAKNKKSVYEFDFENAEK